MIKIQRKVVLHGPSTLTISLPTRWIKKHGIKKGDGLEVEEFDRILKISTEKEYFPIKTIKADFSNLSKDAVKSILAILHKSGYDELELIFNDSKMLKIIQDRIRSMLIGYEIVEQTNKRCLIKSISTNEPKEFANVLRRTFRVSLSLAKSSLEAIKSGDIDKLNDALALEQTNNRLTNFCHRILNKQVSMNKDTTYNYIILWIIECICDDYKYIINYVKANKNIKISKELIELYERVNNLFEEYYNLFYKYTPENMDKLRGTYKELNKLLINRINSRREKTDVLHVYLHGITQKIFDALGSTSGLHF